MKAYQLKINLDDVKPPVWRQVIVPAGLSFSQLDLIINKAIGWDHSHLSEFIFKDPDLIFTEFWDDPGNMYNLFNNTLNSKFFEIDDFFDANKEFVYVYDFGDNWHHTIVIEKIMEDYEYKYPQVLSFEGNTPEQGDYDFEGTNQYMAKKFKLHNRVSYAKNIEELLANTKNSNRGLYRLAEPHGMESIKQTHHEVDSMLNIISSFQKMYLEPQSLSDLLADISKEDIKDIAHAHNLSKFSSFNKDKLIDFVCEKITDEEHMAHILRCLDPNVVNLLGSPDGCGHLNCMDFFDDGINDDLILLATLGYLWLDDFENNTFVIPVEVSKAYQNITSKMDLNENNFYQIRLYLKGAMALYGACSSKQFLKLYKEFTGISLDENILDDFLTYAPGIRKVNNLMVSNDISHEQYEEFMKLWSSLDDYYMPTKSEILDLAKENCISFDIHLNRFAEFLDDHIEDGLVVNDFCVYLQGFLRKGFEPEQCLLCADSLLVLEGNEPIDFEKLLSSDKFGKLYTKVIENTRISTLKGHTITEMLNIKKSKSSDFNPDNSKIIKFPKLN